MSNPYQIVLIDDDADMLEALNHGLQDEFKVNRFTDANDALAHLENHYADALLLDFHMPGKDAFGLYQEFRQKLNRRPIIFLTGDSSSSIKIKGLDLGADDFLHKPISMNELSAHINNRIRGYHHQRPGIIELKNLKINLADPEIELNNKKVTLTKKEFQILVTLALNSNRVVTKAEMIKIVWPNVTVEENNLDTHLSNLRRKLHGFTGKIKTLKCFGYSLRVDA